MICKVRETPADQSAGGRPRKTGGRIPGVNSSVNRYESAQIRI